MRKVLLVVLISGLFTISCKPTISKLKAKEKLESLLHISISNNFEITNYEISSDIHGTYIEQFYIQFNTKEFNEIFGKVMPNKAEFFDNVYGITVTKGEVMISAFFFPDKNQIKYSYIDQ